MFYEQLEARFCQYEAFFLNKTCENNIQKVVFFDVPCLKKAVFASYGYPFGWFLALLFDVILTKVSHLKFRKLCFLTLNEALIWPVPGFFPFTSQTSNDI